MNQDDEHLRLLSIFHYVVGGLTALFSLFGLIHLSLGLLMILAPEKMDAKCPPPAFLGWIFAVVGGSVIALGWTMAAFIVTAGRWLARRKHYLFCLVMAGFECILMPFGTVLGVFTLIVLTREPVKRLFAPAPPPPALP